MLYVLLQTVHHSLQLEVIFGSFVPGRSRGSCHYRLFTSVWHIRALKSESVHRFMSKLSWHLDLLLLAKAVVV